jgi:polysaccharide export outer membrane protein
MTAGAALCLLTVTGCVTPRGERAPAGAMEPAEGDGRLRLDTYHFSPGDEIRIAIYQHPELDRTLRIPPDGHIYFPVVGEIPVTQLNVRELQRVIAAGLAAERKQPIGAGDTLDIRVFRHPEADVTTQVPSSGAVNIPMAGAIAVSGMTDTEASAAIADALRGVLIDPAVTTTIVRSAMPPRIENAQVTVEVTRFGGQKLLVLGEVNRPGVYIDEGGTTLLDAIALAGGATPDAKLSNVAVIRPGNAGVRQQTLLYNTERAIETGDVSQNPFVTRGAVVYVPKTTIANVARFSQYLYTIVRPIVEVETGIWLGQNIDEGPKRGTSSQTVVFR